MKEKEREKKSDKISGEERLERSQKNFFTSAREVRRAFLTKHPMILLLYKEATLLTNSSGKVLPGTIDALLQEFQDVTVKDMPTGLPPIRGIEH